MDALREDICSAIGDWADSIPAIRRGWLFQEGSGRAEGELHVAVELEPVGDSEETLVPWLIHSVEWRSRLQERTTMAVSLQWIDVDSGAGRVAGVLVYDRAGEFRPAA